jgi:hypothetical protein
MFETCTHCKNQIENRDNRPALQYLISKLCPYWTEPCCLDCYYKYIDDNKPSKALLAGRLESFVNNPHYWGITDEKSIAKLLTKTFYTGQFVFWEYWSNKSLVQCVSYKEALHFRPFHRIATWNIVTKNNLLYVTSNSFSTNRGESFFFSYPQALNYIYNRHSLHLHLHRDVHCYCAPRSRFCEFESSGNCIIRYRLPISNNQFIDIPQTKPRVWRLVDLAAFSIRNNLLYHGIEAFRKLPPILIDYVVKYDAIGQALD